MFADSAAITPGRYYFAGPDTPFYSGPNWLGSRNWYDRNNGIGDSLGESLTARQSWDRGNPPAVVPNLEVIGTPDCLASGEPFTSALPFDQIQDGFNVACFVPAIPLDPTWQIASEISSCSLQFFYLTIIIWLYDADIVSMTTAFQLLLGPEAQVTYHPGGGFLPDVVTCVTPICSIAVVDGTVNYQQFATQAFLALVGPQNFGIFSTSPLWYFASTFVNACLANDGANADAPVLLCGHSYGGVSAAVLAARYRRGNPHREVRLLTFGDPKPGDTRLRQILSEMTTIAIANDDDVITALPPDLVTLWPVFVVLGADSMLVWPLWIREPNQLVMDQNGQLAANAAITLDFDTLFNFTVRALAHLQLPPIGHHSSVEYRRRTLVRCPTPEWPVSIALWNFLLGVVWPQFFGDDYFGIDFFGEDYWY